MSAPPLLHFSNFKSITVFSVLQAFSAILSMIERHPAEAGCLFLAFCFWSVQHLNGSAQHAVSDVDAEGTVDLAVPQVVAVG